MSRPFVPFKAWLLAALIAVAFSGCAIGFPTQPTDVTPNAVTLNGTVHTTFGGPVTYWFRVNGEDKTHRTISIPRDEARSVSERIDGLPAGTPYYWELCSQDRQQPGTPVCSPFQSGRTTDDPACGQLVTHDLTLDRDITCSGPVALKIGADNVVVDLAGHAIGINDPRIYDPHKPDPGLERFTVVDNQGHQGTTIRNGTLTYCCGQRSNPGAGRAVALSGSGNLLRDLETQGGVEVSGDFNRIIDARINQSIADPHPKHPALDVTGDYNTIVRARSVMQDGAHTVTITGSYNRYIDSSTNSTAGGGAKIGGDHNIARRVDLSGFLEEGLLLTGTRNRVVDSQIRQGATSAHTLIFRGATGATVRASAITVTAVGSGVEIEGSRDTRLLTNTIAVRPYGPPVPPIDGVHVAADSTGTLLRLNTVTGADDDGIDTDSATTRLDRNTANNNGDFGIEAVPGVTDLGGNRASGNGNPLQCLNVFCQ